ncbi:MAG: response regulator transcription factor [Myxococcaceae bacterium]|nr:response regulator transcription factor [Myxococcaceae bacterium]
MAARPSRATIFEPVSTAAGLSPRARRAKRLRVLLVEPDPRAQAELGRALAEAGFEVMGVASAEDAQAELAAATSVPNLIISETELEGLDGFTFCDQLRAELRTAQVPVFLLASRKETFHHALASSVGADDYLSKPVLAQDVVALARLKAGRRSSEVEFEAHSARLPLMHIARALLTGARSGRVVLKDCDGLFAFRNGHVVDARFQGEHGVLAFRRLLSFGSGVYGVSFGPELHRGSLLMDLAFLREQVLPSLERFERLREVGVPQAARLTVDFQRLAERLPELPDEVIGLVRLFDGRRTVRSVLLDCRLTEVVAFEAITQLFVMGVLAPACHAEEQERVLDAPRFFEPMEAEAARVAREADAQDAEERAADALEAGPEGHEEAQASGTSQPEESVEIDLDEEVPAEAPAAQGPAPIILSFPQVAARRRGEGVLRAQPAEVFQLASGAGSKGPRTADKV